MLVWAQKFYEQQVIRKVPNGTYVVREARQDALKVLVPFLKTKYFRDGDLTSPSAGADLYRTQASFPKVRNYPTLQDQNGPTDTQYRDHTCVFLTIQ